MGRTIKGTQGFQRLEVELARGETFNVERGGLMYYDSVDVSGQLNSKSRGLGGMLGALGRMVTTGESLFLTEITGLRDGSIAVIAPTLMGSIHELDCGRTQYYLNTGSYLASESSVHYDVKRQSLSKAILGGTGGLFIAQTSGNGKLYVNSFGDLIELKVEDFQDLKIDNQHVVAWEETVRYELSVAGGILGYTSGEGIVNNFSGRGKVLVQSRNISGLADAIIPYIPQPRNTNN